MLGFEPILGVSPKILILGSMPSVKSLAVGQYYANPQNSFWWVMGELYQFADSLAYHEKTNELTMQGIAVWDVLRECQRRGSADSNIVRSSEQLNDFETLFATNPSLQLIAFNGGAAEAIFMRHGAALLKQFGHLKAVRLPSTSPAYASMPKQKKLAAWRTALSQ